MHATIQQKKSLNCYPLFLPHFVLWTVRIVPIDEASVGIGDKIKELQCKQYGCDFLERLYFMVEKIVRENSFQVTPYMSRCHRRKGISSNKAKPFY
ncbi:hypothetical protein AVEN_173353-1 [Araneus ventricosus]|uniref:Uncharacterized protein n=1 Tax=Araneus ventricosus TaxID=182803 RepID=A0A4Y2ICZ4_ARAVE|nr:hypothetical protein AVEN_173353-1 [Araneus ventricosus]